MDLVQRHQQDAPQEHGAGGFDVSPDVLQEPLYPVGIPAFPLMEPREVKEALSFSGVNQTDHSATQSHRE